MNWLLRKGQNGLGVTSACAQVAGILAPLVRLVEVTHHSKPMLIDDLTPLAAGCLCLFLPETLNVKPNPT